MKSSTEELEREREREREVKHESKGLVRLKLETDACWT